MSKCLVCGYEAGWRLSHEGKCDVCQEISELSPKSKEWKAVKVLEYYERLVPLVRNGGYEAYYDDGIRLRKYEPGTPEQIAVVKTAVEHAKRRLEIVREGGL